MIGDQLGGPNRTENMVPQDRKHNGGPWNAMESWAASCLGTGNCAGTGYLVVNVNYPAEGLGNRNGWLINPWVPESFKAHFTFEKDGKKGDWTFRTENEFRGRGAFATAMTAEEERTKKPNDCYKGTHDIPY